MPMKGLSIRTLRHHYALVPLFVCVGGGALFAAAYLMRLTQNADSSWNRRKNPHPWQNIKEDQQTKFLTRNFDYSKLKHPRPPY